jgi:Zn-dependent protease
LTSHWKRIVVSFAGPLAGFFFLTVFLAFLPFLAPRTWEDLLNLGRVILGWPLQAATHPPDTPLQHALVYYVVFINLIWGLVNLLPIWPLDGGQISRDFLGWLLPGNGVLWAFGISALVAGFIAVNAVLQMNGRPLVPFIPIGGWWSVLLFGSLALGSIQAYHAERNRQAWTDEHLTRWDRDDDDRYWRR